MGVDTVYRPRIHLVQSDPRREGVGFQLRERYEAATTGRVRGGVVTVSVRILHRTLDTYEILR